MNSPKAILKNLLSGQGNSGLNSISSGLLQNTQTQRNIDNANAPYATNQKKPSFLNYDKKDMKQKIPGEVGKSKFSITQRLSKLSGNQDGNQYMKIEDVDQDQSDFKKRNSFMSTINSGKQIELERHPIHRMSQGANNNPLRKLNVKQFQSHSPETLEKDKLQKFLISKGLNPSTQLLKKYTSESPSCKKQLFKIQSGSGSNGGGNSSRKQKVLKYKVGLFNSQNLKSNQVQNNGTSSSIHKSHQSSLPDACEKLINDVLSDQINNSNGSLYHNQSTDYDRVILKPTNKNLLSLKKAHFAHKTNNNTTLIAQANMRLQGEIQDDKDRLIQTLQCSIFKLSNKKLIEGLKKGNQMRNSDFNQCDESNRKAEKSGNAQNQTQMPTSQVFSPISASKNSNKKKIIVKPPQSILNPRAYRSQDNSPENIINQLLKSKIQQKDLKQKNYQLEQVSPKLKEDMSNFKNKLINFIGQYKQCLNFLTNNDQSNQIDSSKELRQVFSYNSLEPTGDFSKSDYVEVKMNIQE
ncbi:UNKNOWN [Stylonychia lemnae]|uniref:Uncharacterized protein n=1 Tax=Stylonychia lemnae TaxID=5949 RepID=A0A078ADH3_STYLE|nr:UNKNOWN [Stylonychia lemnae]|eukprot:CDW80300.1 UNKNOWN [Stylonychia lemnae]